MSCCYIIVNAMNINLLTDQKIIGKPSEPTVPMFMSFMRFMINIMCII